MPVTIMPISGSKSPSERLCGSRYLAIGEQLAAKTELSTAALSRSEERAVLSHGLFEPLI
ncbi:MAG: hypothetical protein IJH95_02875 [Mogibacterium sp.]|nr:hypothetical protein [Mogibacterium sp.]